MWFDRWANVLFLSNNAKTAKGLRKMYARISWKLDWNADRLGLIFSNPGLVNMVWQRSTFLIPRWPSTTSWDKKQHLAQNHAPEAKVWVCVTSGICQSFFHQMTRCIKGNQCTEMGRLQVPEKVKSGWNDGWLGGNQGFLWRATTAVFLGTRWRNTNMREVNHWSWVGLGYRDSRVSLTSSFKSFLPSCQIP